MKLTKKIARELVRNQLCNAIGSVINDTVYMDGINDEDRKVILEVEGEIRNRVVKATGADKIIHGCDIVDLAVEGLEGMDLEGNY